MGKVIMKRLLVSAASLLLIATPAFAQADAFKVGTVVTDANGGPVGTVTAVNGDVVTVHTDKLDANLAKASFTPSEGKLLVGLTQAELNAAVEKDQAAAAASLAVGAEVKGTGGAVLGTIDAIDGEFVTIKLASGSKVRIPRSGIAGSASGAVVGLTAEQLEAQVAPTAQPGASAQGQ
jgi:preprotein translocase subunit YajC